MSEQNGTGARVELAILKGPTSGALVLTETGIELADDTSFEQWREGLKLIKWMKTKVTIGLADYIAWGTSHFSKEKVDEALQQLEFDAPFVRAGASIANIPQELRFPNLGSEHYLEIVKADLPKSKQIRWARVASEQDLTPIQLRFSIKENAVVSREASRSLATGVITIHGIRQQFDVWIKRVGGIEGILKMEKDHQEEIIGELQSIVQFGTELNERLTPAATE